MGNSSNIHVLNLSSYTAPKVIKVTGKDWVEYKLEDTKEEYFTYLQNRILGSTTHGSVVNNMAKLIYGKGLSATDAARNTEQYAQMKSIVKEKGLRKVIKERKGLEMAAFQVTKESGVVTVVDHFPINTLRPEIADEEGNIKNYYYYPDWDDKKYNKQPIKIPAFGFGPKSGNEIYIIKPYVTGHFYFSPPDFSGALPYAVLEEDIGDYLINDIKNGFSGTKVINFNNGIPDDDKQEEIVKKTTEKVTGANGLKVIVGFNNDVDSKTTVDDLPLNDAPDHYQYLAQEAENKILKAHRAPSWLLGANSGGQGIGSNADEIKNQFLIFDNYEIKPYQLEIIEALNEILAINDISLNLYFKTLEPLEFIETEGMDKETKEEETGIDQRLSLSADLEEFLSIGEDPQDGWELVSEQDVDYDSEEQLDLEIQKKNNPSILKQIINLVSTGVAIPNAKSEQDADIDGVKYKVRYSYSGSVSENTRPFCAKMLLANKLYRKEDIIAMESKTVNAGWGPGGSNTYSIWFYKGGGNCNHKWVRKTFRFTGTTGDTKSPLATTISTGKAESEGYRVRNPKQVAMKPKDMANDGFLS